MSERYSKKTSHYKKIGHRFKIKIKHKVMIIKQILFFQEPSNYLCKKERLITLSG